jgi:hypothetical protein
LVFKCKRILELQFDLYQHLEHLSCLREFSAVEELIFFDDDGDGWSSEGWEGWWFNPVGWFSSSDKQMTSISFVLILFFVGKHRGLVFDTDTGAQRPLIWLGLLSAITVEFRSSLYYIICINFYFISFKSIVFVFYIFITWVLKRRKRR